MTEGREVTLSQELEEFSTLILIQNRRDFWNRSIYPILRVNLYPVHVGWIHDQKLCLIVVLDGQNHNEPQQNENDNPSGDRGPGIAKIQWFHHGDLSFTGAQS